MHPFTHELIALCKHIGIAERDTVCCGNVSVQQCTALQYLLAAPSDVSSIATALGITVSASTRLLDGMHRRGWIARNRDPNDRRRVLVNLSDDGHREATELRDLTNTLAMTLLEHIPAEKHAQIIESIQLIRGALDTIQTTVKATCGPGS